MNKFFKIFFFLVVGFSTQAQNAAKAKGLLDEVSAQIKTYSNITIDFKYSLHNPKENINQESNGNVALQGNLYNLNFMGVTKIFDGKNIAGQVMAAKRQKEAEKARKNQQYITSKKLAERLFAGYPFNVIEVNITDINLINRVTKGTYELGSVFKPFTFASALNNDLIKPETEFLKFLKATMSYFHQLILKK